MIFFFCTHIVAIDIIYQDNSAVRLGQAKFAGGMVPAKTGAALGYVVALLN